MSSPEIQSFTIGDKVAPKTIGFPGVGLIVGIIHGMVYSSYSGDYMPKLWNVKYPDWAEGIICIVLFDEERKPCTKGEFRTIFPSTHYPNMIYDDLIPSKLIAYPFKDLFLFEKFEEYINEE